MSLKSRTFKLFWYSFIYLFVTIAVTAAVILTVARVWLPTAENYKDDIERWVGDILEQQVVIQSLNADWRGFEPQLVLEKVQFLTRDGKTIISAFDRVKIGFDLYASILQQAPVPGALVVEGARIVLVRKTDGSFSVAGFGSENASFDDSTETNKVLEDWLLSQRLLKIENSSLVWRDRKNKDETRLFSDVNITLRNDGTRHQIEGSVFLPQDLGSHVLFFLDLRGNVFSSNDWSGSAQITGVGLELVNWLDETRFQDLELVNGNVSFSSWARLRSAQLEDLRGEVLASNLQIRSLKSRRLTKIDNISSDFSLQLADNKWRVTADQLLISHNSKTWPKLRVDVNADPASKTYEVEATQIDLAKISSLLTVSDVFSGDPEQYLKDARPQGMLEAVSIFLHQGEDKFSYAIGGRFRGIELRTAQGIPGLSNVSGEFEWSNADGYVWFDSDLWSLDYRAMFKKARQFSKLKGSLTWEKRENGWRLYGNNLALADDKTNASGRFILDQISGKSPFLDLAVGLKGKDIVSVQKYLPDAMMSKGLVSWIENAVDNVTVTNGGLVYYGYLDRYPFASGDGKFGLDLTLKDTKLQFLKGWPAIESISGNLEVSSTGLFFSSTGAKVKHNRLENVVVSIPEFSAEDVALTIAGNIVGPTKEKLQYMFDSPLNEMFASNLRIFEAEGNSDLTLGMTIPLADNDEDFYVAGSLAMDDNRLFAKSIDLDLSHINGNLRFDDAGIYAENLQTSLGPFNLNANVDTVELGGGREMVFSQQGGLDEKQIAYIFDRYVGQPQWKSFIKGSTQAEVKLYIPISEQSMHKQLTLLGRSNLKGISIDLPQPLGKTADAENPFKIRAELTGGNRDLEISLGDINTRMVFISAGGDLRIDRGVVGLGVKPELPKENAFHFVGKLDRFFWRDWEPLLIPKENQPGLLRSGGGATSVYFDVAVKEAEILGAKFNDVNLQASNTVQGWAIHANGPEIQGSVYFPLIWTSTPLVFDMKKLHVNLEASDEEKSTIDPRDLPKIRFSSDSLRFNKIDFGKTTFESSLLKNGIQLDKFSSDSKNAKIKSSGSWVIENEVNKSKFSIDMKAKDFGSTMKSFDLTDALEKGNGELKVDASWDGAPVDFTFNTLKGKLDINMQNLRLLDLNIGAAKILGLLSLEAIPRRLFFDFRDVVQKGMVFDNVQGQFDVQNGDAFTSGVLLTGPTARMGLAGRIGLNAKDYDLVITFIPKTLETLPVIGGIASTVTAVDPTIGAGLYVMQKLLQSQLDELSAVQYTVAGSWQSPIVTQVKSSSRTPEDSEFVDEQ